MNSFNRVTLLGNVGNDPETKTTTSGKKICSFSVACNDQWKDNEGKECSRVTWIRVVTWGKRAESCGKYLSKGRQVLVEGSLRSREWETRDGEKRQTLELVASHVTFLSSPKKNNSLVD